MKSIFQVLFVWISLSWMVKIEWRTPHKTSNEPTVCWNGDVNSVCASFWNGTFVSFQQAYFTVFRESMNHLSFWTVWVKLKSDSCRKNDCFIWVFPFVTLKTLKQADNWTFDDWNIYVGNGTMLMVLCKYLMICSNEEGNCETCY